MKNEELIVTSSSFVNNGYMNKNNTADGEDKSPDFQFENLTKNGVTIAIIMEDLDVPFVGTLDHWLIWNLPCVNHIEGGIPEGENISALNSAQQGIGYGRHVYRGPNIPFFLKKTHRYLFKIFVLDVKIDIPNNSHKKDLIKAMNGHIIQKGSITGLYKN